MNDDIAELMIKHAQAICDTNDSISNLTRCITSLKKQIDALEKRIFNLEHHNKPDNER